jgi:Cys-rich four helix bundle protein (predicted Tat secretion target)
MQISKLNRVSNFDLLAAINSRQAFRLREGYRFPIITPKETIMKQNETASDTVITRRELLIGAGAAATALAGSAVYASDAGKHQHGDHAGHRHEDHTPRHPQLLDQVNNCIDKGRRCISHCLVAFKEGDTSLAECAAKTHEMEAICQAFAYLVTSNSIYLKDQARICATVCADCEEACKEHADHHAECRDCAKACRDVVKAIETLLA